MKYGSEILHLWKAPCEHRFKVIQTAKQPSRACDVTGVAAVACSQHGCFSPNAIVC